MNIPLTKQQQGYLVMGAVGLGVVWYLSTRARAAAGELAEAVNPVNRDNIFARGVNAVGDVFDNGSNDDSFRLGAWIYDITHPNEGKSTMDPPASRVNEK